jgi:site-specific recombinase XerD
LKLESKVRGELVIIQGKGRKDCIVPIGEYACTFTLGYLKLVRPWLVKSTGEDALFVNSKTGERISAVTVNYLVKKAVKRANLEKAISPHTFRHACATHLLRNKADLRHIQAILGHSKLSSTQIYTPLTFEDLKDAVKRAHPRGRR